MTYQALFSSPTAEIRKILALLPEILEQVRPLTRKQQQSLPEDIFRLSRLLTTERRELTMPYWSSPALVSAYCYYFWPWNMVRLASLLPNLPLPAVPTLGEGENAWLVDMGSGPLTLPISLWLARPDLRASNIRVFAQDSARQPLALGQRLFEALAAHMGQRAWSTVIHQGPLEGAIRASMPRLAQGEKLWLLTAANVLNEYCQGRKNTQHRGFQDEDDEDSQSSLQMRMEDILGQWGAHVQYHKGSALLCVEPGTRLGGKIVMQARGLLHARGLRASVPCTHSRTCPLERGHSWCHFTFAAQAVPSWLANLSAKAGLTKEALSLAPLLVTGEQQKGIGTGTSARIISTPFVVPGLRGRGRYACTDKGLILLEDADDFPSGALLEVSITAEAERDKKSGALIVRRRGGAGAGQSVAGDSAKREQKTRQGAKSRGQKAGHSRKGPRQP